MSSSTSLDNVSSAGEVAQSTTSAFTGGAHGGDGAGGGSPLLSNLKLASGGWVFKADSLLAIGMVSVLGVMLLPLPTLLLDLLLATSIALGLVVFLFSLHIEKPLEFSTFPSLVLLLTLFRLALNIASTRTILLHGGEGEGAAGSVIQAFGNFVVGGNLVVGVIVFLILVVINFVVITKGAGRIAEVTARFTLDAMPGKQMSIDADLAAGLINEAEAKTRRSNIEREADFFGSMDGASKFVRGDAIAGLAITAVNIIGGFVIGVMQQDMSAAEAATTYTSLTVGDGLVSQIPALLGSIAAGLVTTRASAGGALGDTMKRQMFGAKRPTAIASGVLIVLGLVPGMPHFAFFALAGGLWWVSRGLTDEDEIEEAGGEQEAAPVSERQEIEQMLPLDLLEIEVGYELVPLVDADRDGSLLRRINGIRKQQATELGILIPPIHLRDNLRLRPGGYRILLSGNEIGGGELKVGKWLVMNPGGEAPEIPGDDAIEPAFGLRAKWIAEEYRDEAEMAGYTVVDAATVCATHLGELLTQEAHHLLGRREVQELLDLHGQQHSRVIEDLIPTEMSVTTLVKVLRNLLKERVSIRDFRTILEALADNAQEVKDPGELSERVRQRLSRQVTRTHLGDDGTLHTLVLTPQVESLFRRMSSPGTGAIDPTEVQGLLGRFEEAVARVQHLPNLPVLVTAADIRRAVSTFVARHLQQLSVLSFREVDANVSLSTVGVVGDVNGA